MVKKGTPNESDHTTRTGIWSSRSGQRRSDGNARREKSDNKKHDLMPWHNSCFFTPQEEDLVIQLHAAIGSRWLIIAQQLQGKTENDVKILWNSKLRKKLSAMGIDPVTHKPFPQILADYGKIGTMPKTHQTGIVDFKPSNTEFYSQLQAINLVTKHKTESVDEWDSQGITSSSFKWTEFLVNEDVSCGNEEENAGAMNDEKSNGFLLDVEFEACSSYSNASSFVDAIIERSKEQIFPLFPLIGDEPF